MKYYLMVFGLAMSTSIVPMQAFGQNFLQGEPGLGGSSAATPDINSPDATTPGPNANPFMGAAGASRYYQDNSLTGSSVPDIANPTGSNNPSAGAPGGTASGPLDGAAPTDNDNAATWATTP